MTAPDTGKLTVAEIKEVLVISDKQYDHFLPALLLPVFSPGLFSEIYNPNIDGFDFVDLIEILRKFRDARFTFGASVETSSEEIAFTYPGEGVRYAVIRSLAKEDLIHELNGIVSILSSKLTINSLDRALLEYARYLSISILQSEDLPETVVSKFDKSILESQSGLDGSVNSETLQIMSLILDKRTR